MPHPDDFSDDELGHRLQQALRALPDAPPGLLRAAIGLWPAGALVSGLHGAALGLLSRLSAVLAFDSWAAPASALGMRSLRAPTRQLLYTAQGRDIDLRIAPADLAFSLTGQVLGPDETGQLELTRLDDDAAPSPQAPWVREAPLDALGEFRFEGLAPGRYTLTLFAGGCALELPPFDCGETAN